MEYLAVITALNRYCSFGKHFVQLKKKKKKKKHLVLQFVLGKTVHSVFSTGTQDFAIGHTYFDVLCLKEHVFTH